MDQVTSYQVEPVLVIHGVGARDQERFAKTVHALNKVLGDQWSLIPIFWGDLGATNEPLPEVLPDLELLEDMSTFEFFKEIASNFDLGMRWFLTHKLFPFLADALVYQSQRTRAQIHARVMSAVPPGYGTETRPISVIAHSLGGVIAFDSAVCGSPPLWIKHFVTMGSQPALFHAQDPRITLVEHTVIR